MTLHRLLKGLHSLIPGRGSRRRAPRTARIVPVIASIPGSDVWFLRYALGFLAHLGEGGHVTDRLRNRVVGNPAGRPFNFDNLRGGPLLWAPKLIRPSHLFIGYTSCPGFSRIAAKFPWWQDTRYCAPSFDYFHDGLDYAQVPVDLAPHAYCPVSVSGMEDAAWTERTQRAVLLQADPIEQAAIYFNYCRGDLRPAYNTLDGRRLTDWAFRDYLLQHALPSYAKIFISYQAMAAEVPGSVSILPFQQVIEKPAEALTSILSHLTGQSRGWPMLDEAIDLARQDHLAAVAAELGRPMDRARRRRKMPVVGPGESVPERLDPNLRREAFERLTSFGVDPRYFASLAGAASADPHALLHNPHAIADNADAGPQHAAW